MVSGQNFYLDAGSTSRTITMKENQPPVLMIAGQQGAGLIVGGNLTIENSTTNVVNTGYIFSGGGFAGGSAETTNIYGSSWQSQNPFSGIQSSTLTFNGGDIVVVGSYQGASPAIGKGNGLNGYEALFTTYRSNWNRDEIATARATIGATGDVIFQNSATLTLGLGSHLLSQTGGINFKDSILIVDINSEEQGLVSNQGSDTIIWSHKDITAQNANNYILGQNLWIENHIGNISWQGKYIDSSVAYILAKEGNINLETKATEDGDGTISMTYNRGDTPLWDIPAKDQDKGIIRALLGSLTLSANGKNESGVGIDLDGMSLSATENITLTARQDDQTNTILNMSKTHIGNHEAKSANLTINADARLNSGSGGDASNITVNGGLSLDSDEYLSGYASHLIASEKMDVNASGKNVNVQNGAYLNLDGSQGQLNINADHLQLGGAEDSQSGSYILASNGSKTNITANSVALNNQSHIGQEVDNSEGGSVSVTTSKLELDNESFVTSSEAVNISASDLDNGLEISFDQDTDEGKQDSWIKGHTVNIGMSESAPSNHTTTITGGSVTATDSVNIGGSNIAISDAQLGNSSTSRVQISGGDGHTVSVNDGSRLEGSSISVNAGSGENSKVEIFDATLGDSSGKSEISIGGGEGSSIAIGSTEESIQTTIQGGKVAIGDEDYSVGVEIKGVRPESGTSNTIIKGSNIGIDSNGGDTAISGVDLGLNSGNGEISVGVGSGNLQIDDSVIDATGGIFGEGGFGQGSATGSINIDGGSSGESWISNSQISSNTSVGIDGNLDINDSTITADQSVNFGQGGTTGGHVTIGRGSTVSGGSVAVGSGSTVDLGIGESAGSLIVGNSDKDDGQLNVSGELNVGGNGSVVGSGDLTIGTGTQDQGSGSINITTGGSITAGSKDSTTGGNLVIGGTGDVNVEGGSLVANNGDGSNKGNVTVNGGNVNLGGAGSIEADGIVTVGSAEGGTGAGSINVGSGESGTIIAAGSDSEGNNVVVGNGGTINVGQGDSQGSLVISGDKDNLPSTEGNKGLIIDSDTNVSIGQGGYVVSDDITFAPGEGSSNGKLDVSGGTINTSSETILGNASADGDGNIVFDDSSRVQISGTTDADTVEDLNNALGGAGGPTLVLDQVDGLSPDGDPISKEDMENIWHGAVLGDAVIDASGDGDSTLTHGGGGSIIVDVNNDGKGGKLTIAPSQEGNPGNVTITGSETDLDHSIVLGKDQDGQLTSDGEFDIVLEDGSDLTLGKDGALGGHLSGDIVASTSTGGDHQASDVTVEGGHFTVDGSLDLSHNDQDATNDGNLNIYDHNTTNPSADNGLTVGGDVAAGDLTMTGGDTILNVGGSLDLSGDAQLAQNADLTVAGEVSVDGVLDLSGNASLGASGEGDHSLTVGGGLDISDNAQINRGEISVGTENSPKDAYINGNGGLTANGDFTVSGEVQIGTGKDLQGSETLAGRPQVSVNDGNMTSGDNMTIAQGQVSVTGEQGSENQGNVIVGNHSNSANLDIGTVTMPREPAVVDVDNNINVVNGNANIHGNAEVTVGGVFDIKGSGDNGNATINGTLVAGSADVNQNLTIGTEDSSARPNGSFVTAGGTTVGGNLTVNDYGQMQVGIDPEKGGDLSVTGGMTTGTGSTVQVAGGIEVGEDAVFEGTVSAGGNADFNSNLVIGEDFGESEVPSSNGSFTSGGKTDVAGDLVINDNGILNVGQNPTTDGDDGLTVNGRTTIGDNATVTVAGDITFGDENSNQFGLGSGSTITAGGAINFGSGTKFDNPLNGFITAPDGINFGSSDVIFSGNSAGTNTSHFIGDATYNDGARFEITQGTSDDGSVEPGRIDGKITIASGASDDQLGAIFTTDPLFNAGDHGQNAVLHVNQSVSFGKNGGLIVGDVDQDKAVGSGVFVGDNALVSFDFSDFTNGQKVFVDANDDPLSLTNASSSEGSIKIDISGWTLGAGGTIDMGWKAGDSLEDLGFEIAGINGLLQFDVNGDGLLVMTGADTSGFVGLDKDLGEVVEAVFNDQNGNRNIQDALGFGLGSGYVTTDEAGNPVISSAGNQFIQDVLSVPIAAGAFNIAYDAMSEFNASVERRALEPRTANSTAFWADVIATTNKAETLFGHSGYSADLYAGVLGTDTTFDNGALVGLAITVGKADGDPEGAELKMSNDADYYGVSLYAVQNFDKWEVKGDIGYMHVKNDIGADFNLGGNVDTDVITAGARMGFAAYESDRVKVMPRFGVRYANFSIDSLNGTKVKDINVLETPIGVEVSGKFDMKGWKVAPRVDMSVVPEFGDKHAKINNSGASLRQDVLNSALVNTTLGVSAQKGNVGVGLDYRLGLGNEERENHSFIANIRYQF